MISVDEWKLIWVNVCVTAMRYLMVENGVLELLAWWMAVIWRCEDDDQEVGMTGVQVDAVEKHGNQCMEKRQLR